MLGKIIEDYKRLKLFYFKKDSMSFHIFIYFFYFDETFMA